MLLKRNISAFLLWVFMLYITPKEMYHLFVSHHDTEHAHSKSLTEISNAHHHCELLKADQQFASSDVIIPFYDFSVNLFFDSNTNSFIEEELLPSRTYSSKQLRAPPFSV